MDDGGQRTVGRTEELDALERALARAASGRPQIVLVTGEPGIGKTRMIDELWRRSRRDGFLMLEGRLTEYEGDR